MVTQMPVIVLYENFAAYEYRTSNFTGWPTATNYYDAGSPYQHPEDARVVLHLTPSTNAVRPYVLSAASGSIWRQISAVSLSPLHGCRAHAFISHRVSEWQSPTAAAVSLCQRRRRLKGD